MNEGSLQDDVHNKRWELRQRIKEIREVSCEIKDEIEDDKYRNKNIKLGYDNTRGMLDSTMKSLDKVLANSETRIMIYVIGGIVIAFLIFWKLLR